MYVASTSEADSITIDGADLTVADIPDGSPFILKTTTHNNALNFTPSGDTLTLTYDASNFSSGNITEWTLNSSTAATTVAHIVGAPLANIWYAISVDGTHLNSYQTDSGGALSFTYSGGFSAKTFTIAQDTTAPISFSLTSPTNNSATTSAQPTFTWNASTDPDISYYQLYIDSSLDTNSITTTSQASTNLLSCGTHTWYVTAVDNAGNSTNSSTFTLTINCGGGSVGGGGTANIPTPRLQTVKSDGTVVYHEQSQSNEQTTKVEQPQTTTSSYKFTKTLKPGQTNEEVKKLQQILNQNGYILTQTGLGSPNNETDFFGRLTRQAVQKFQCDHLQICEGSPTVNGYGLVGPRTREALNNLTLGEKQEIQEDNQETVQALQNQIRQLKEQLDELIKKMAEMVQ